MRRFSEPESTALFKALSEVLMPTALFHFLASTFPNGAHLWLNPCQAFKKLGRAETEIHVGLASKLVTLSLMKPEKISGKDFL
jgi:hypothetical protein